MNDLKILESYIPIAQFIAAVAGPNCEVAIHNLADLNHSIIYIENGHLTGRSVGDPLLDFNSHAMLNPDNSDKDFIANYEGLHTVQNRIFRFSTYYIRNNSGKIIGLLNTNVDVSDFIKLRDAISRNLLFEDGDPMLSSLEMSSAATISTEYLIDQTFNNAMVSLGYTDPAALSTKEKVKVVQYFFEHNIFDLKGAVGIIAKKLSVSEPTVYRYRHNIQK